MGGGNGAGTDFAFRRSGEGVRGTNGVGWYRLGGACRYRHLGRPGLQSSLWQMAGAFTIGVGLFSCLWQRRHSVSHLVRMDILVARRLAGLSVGQIDNQHPVFRSSAGGRGNIIRNTGGLAENCRIRRCGGMDACRATPNCRSTRHRFLWQSECFCRGRQFGAVAASGLANRVSRSEDAATQGDLCCRIGRFDTRPAAHLVAGGAAGCHWRSCDLDGDDAQSDGVS